jgi:hypothetical protein
MRLPGLNCTQSLVLGFFVCVWIEVLAMLGYPKAAGTGR